MSHTNTTGKLRRWLLTAAAASVVAAVAGCDSDDDPAPTPASAQLQASPSDETQQETRDEAAEEAARERTAAREAITAAIDEDDYPAAIAAAETLSAQEQDQTRRRISNAIGRRVVRNLRNGELFAAQALLRDADSYPATDQLSAARDKYRAAKQRREQRITQELNAIEPDPVPFPERPAPLPEITDEDLGGSADGNCSSEYEGACVPADVGDVDCGELSDTDFSSVGSDPYRLDADSDGIACES